VSALIRQEIDDTERGKREEVASDEMEHNISGSAEPGNDLVAYHRTRATFEAGAIIF